MQAARPNPLGCRFDTVSKEARSSAFRRIQKRSRILRDSRSRAVGGPPRDRAGYPCPRKPQVRLEVGLCRSLPEKRCRFRLKPPKAKSFSITPCPFARP